jgi:hypothetical protein
MNKMKIDEQTIIASDNARKLIAGSVPGLYTISGDIENLPIDIVRTSYGQMRSLGLERRYVGSFAENLSILIAIRSNAKRDLEDVVNNPVWAADLRQGIGDINRVLESVCRGDYKIVEYVGQDLNLERG